MDNFPLSPEEQAFSTAVGGENQPWKFGKGEFDLIKALEVGYSKKEIAEFLSQQKNFNYGKATSSGYSDGEIISHLLGAGAFDAFTSQFVYNMGESALGLTQAGTKVTGGEFNKKRAQAFSDAADILSEGESFGKWAGIISGSMADPVSIPAGFLKFLKSVSLVKELAMKGGAQGFFGGLVAPTYKEDWGDILAEKAEKTVVGTVFGAGIGAGLGKGIDLLSKRAEVKAKEPAIDTSLNNQKETTDSVLSSLIQKDQDIRAKQQADALEQTVQEIAPAEVKISGKDITNRPLGGDEEKLIRDRIATLQSQVDDLRWKQAEGEAPTKDEATQQVAALFRGKEKAPEQLAENLPPQPGAGLVAPTKQTPQTELAALLRKPEAAPTQPIQVEKDTPKLAALLRSQGIDNDIKIKQEQIKMLQQQLLESNQRKAAMEQPELVQVETRRGPAPTAPAPMQAPAPTQAPVRSPTTTQAPLPLLAQPPSEPALRVTSQGWTPEMGGNLLGHLPVSALTDPKNIKRAMDVLGASTEQQFIKTSIPLLQQRGNVLSESEVRSILNIPKVDDAMRMQGSVGAAGVRPESILAGQTIFPTVEKAAEKVALGKAAPKLSREELGVPALEKMVSQTVGFLGKPLKQMREGGDFAGTLKGSQEAGEKLIAKAKKEEGSLIGYFLKQDDAGNFTNLDKTWNRADVAAFAPVVKYAERVYEALMDEAVALRKAGQLEGNALNDIAYRLQFPIQIFGVLQGKRTEASRTLNAYKLLRENWDSGKEVKGYFAPNTPCM